MSKPITCPHCDKPLTDEQVLSIKAKFSRRLVRNPGAGHNGGRPRKPPHPFDSACDCRLCRGIRRAMHPRSRAKGPHPYDPTCGCGACLAIYNPRKPR